MTRKPADTVAAHELTLYATNDADLYRQMALPIIANLARKVAKGTYDHDLAVKAWRHFADSASLKYAREFATQRDAHVMFSPATRDLAAVEIRDCYDEHVREMAVAS
jgi:hypothetical protein